MNLFGISSTAQNAALENCVATIANCKRIVFASPKHKTIYLHLALWWCGDHQSCQTLRCSTTIDAQTHKIAICMRFIFMADN